MCCGERKPDFRCNLYDCSCRRFCCKPMDRSQLNKTHTKSLYDSPASECGSKCHCSCTSYNYPKRYMKLREFVVTHQSYRDNSHCLLCIVAAVAESHISC